MASKENVILDKEEFSIQRAYLYALTIRSDVSRDAKILIKKIEERLSTLAEVKSHFTDHKGDFTSVPNVEAVTRE